MDSDLLIKKIQDLEAQEKETWGRLNYLLGMKEAYLSILNEFNQSENTGEESKTLPHTI